MIQGEQANGNDLFQLAVNKSGVIRGNYYNALSDTTAARLRVRGQENPARRLDGRRPQGADLRSRLRQPDQVGNDHAGAFRQGPHSAVDFGSDGSVHRGKVGCVSAEPCASSSGRGAYIEGWTCGCWASCRAQAPSDPIWNQSRPSHAADSQLPSPPGIAAPSPLPYHTVTSPSSSSRKVCRRRR